MVIFDALVREQGISAAARRLGVSKSHISKQLAQLETELGAQLVQRTTRRFALTAERFSGLRARELGLLAECYPQAELEQQIAHWIDNLLLNSPQAMRACKDLLREVSHGAPTPAIRRYCENAIARIRVSPEGQEGLRAFLQKRTPRWQTDTSTQEPRS